MQSKGGQCCRQEGFSQNQPGSPSCPSLKVPELCESCKKEREGVGITGDKWSNPPRTPLAFRLYLSSFCYMKVLVFLLLCLSFPSWAHGDLSIPSRGCRA